MEGIENASFGGETGADDEGKVEAFAIAGIEVGELVELGVREAVESESGLFAGGVGSEVSSAGELACEIGVSADEGELFLVACGVDGFSHGRDERGAVGERTLG